MEFALRYECLVNPVYPMPSLGFVLEDVQNAGLSMGIVSNAQFFTPLLFEAFLGKGIKELGFAEELCVFSFLVGEAKPSARLFEIPRDILLDRGIDPESILYVGNDMLNDILCAKDAGFRTALFAGDSRSLRLREGDGRVRDCEPDWIITSLDQLQAFL
jgi:putative hydrolase of the HAD superfamily